MKVEKIKKAGKKYKIVLDNESKITTYDDVILENGLLYHPNIDLDLLNKIEKDTVYYDVYYKTVNFITRKLRSEKEIGLFIDKQNVPEKDKQEIICKLTEIGFINDDVFMKAYISDRIHLSNDGPYKIKRELLQHDIEEEKIDSELSNVSSTLLEEKITKLMMKKCKGSKYTGYYLKQKVLNDMMNLGYDRDMCSTLFEHLEIDSQANLEKEYEKIISKLKTKYSGRQLEQKIKQKLYQKGFQMEEIQRIIDNHFTE